MTRHDPIADDDLLIDELLAGRVPDEPVFAGLALWRRDVVEGAPAAVREDPADHAWTGADALSAPAGRRLSRGTTARRSRSARRGGRRHRAAGTGAPAGRASAIAVGGALLLAMGVGQAVAGNPVAPLQYVVARAVGIGEGVASPRASDVRAPITPASPSPPPRSLHGARADAEAVSSTHGDAAATPAPSRDERGHVGTPHAEDPTTSVPTPRPGPAPAPAPRPTEPTPSLSVPDHPGAPEGEGRGRGRGHGRGEAGDSGSERGRSSDHNANGGGGADSNPDRGNVAPSGDELSGRPWYVVN